MSTTVLVHPTRHRMAWAGALLALVAIAVVAALAILRARKATTKMEDAAIANMPGMETAPQPPAGAGSSAAYISPARQQLIGVRTGLVERQREGATTRTVGMLSYDQTRVTEVHVRFPGWVEHLFVDYVGQPVRRGQPLFALYSPEVVTAQSDYLVALRARDAAPPQVRADSDALLNAAHGRLEQRWDMSESQIAAVQERGRPSRTLTVFSPFDGVVLERKTFAGQYVMPEMSTFKIADLSTIWAIGQAFEYEAAHLRVGETIDVEFPYAQAPQTLKAQIDFIYPDVDPQTRRIRFRASLPNTDGRLKPDTYVTLVLHGETVERLVVPKEAVIDTGVRTYVMLALPNGYFDPRDVQVGPAVGDVYPVISGLAAGDRVVTSAQFLVDSETNLKSAMQNMAATMPGMNMGESKPPSTAPSASSSATLPLPRMTMPSSSSKTAPTHEAVAPPNAPQPTPSSTPPPPPSMSSMPGM